MNAVYHQAVELMELMEDTVEHHCDENFLSGQKVWTMIHALCEAKLDDYPDHTWVGIDEEV